MEKFSDYEILIVKNDIKNKVIEKLSKEGLLNTKVLSLEEVRDKYYFTYNEQAIYYLIKKYNYQVDVAKMYLSNMKYVKEEDYDNNKIRKIIELKNELNENNLLIYNIGFKNYLKNKNIIIYNYYNLSKNDNVLINELKKENNVTIYNDELNEYNHRVIYEADTLEEEVCFVASDIVSKINDGLDINCIKICGINGEYTSVIKRIFNWYNIPVSINESTIYSTKIGQDFIENLSNNAKESIEKLKKKYDKEESANNVINKLIKILNKYVWVNDLLEVKSLILEDVKNTKINQEEYINEVKIIKKLNEASEDDYVY